MENKEPHARHHVDKSIQPTEKDGRFPVERETKIKYLGSREEFVAQAEGLGAELAEATRLIDDLRYLPGENFIPGAVTTVNKNAFLGPEGGIDEARAAAALELLGFEVKRKPKVFELRGPESMVDKTVRIRNDGGVWIFTAKSRVEKLDENGYIEEKPELEVELKDPEALKGFLERDLGLALESHRQKLRTSYRLKTGQLVELNESPAFETKNVPFWLEIEGRDLTDIETAAKAFGFNRDNFFKGSDKKFLMKVGGLSEDETRQILF